MKLSLTLLLLMGSLLFPLVACSSNPESTDPADLPAEESVQEEDSDEPEEEGGDESADPSDED